MRFHLRSCLGLLLSLALSIQNAAARPASPRPTPARATSDADKIHRRYPEPVLPFDEPLPDPPPNDDLAAAIGDAYATNPQLGARRYELRATDDALGTALAETRATANVQVTTGYSFTNPGRVTAANRFSDRNIRTNDLGAQFVLEQPLSTGGRARADVAAARGDIAAARAALRGAEGDLLVALMTAYADMRRDLATFWIRQQTEHVLAAMLGEVIARRSAGELTRTDIAQAEVQLQAARVTANAAHAQLEQSRAGFAALVGRDPGILAPPPALPLLPVTLDDAFDRAQSTNPELAQTIAAEKASRARIAAARAHGHPTLALRGIAGSTGPISPLYSYNEDLSWSGRATLTVPILNGGRVAAAVDQALDRNSGDRMRIEAARRQAVQNILVAWNQMVAAERNRDVQQEQLKAARVFYEGTFAEYRAGLRSTFDVLYAQNTLRDTQVALLGTDHDDFVARATLLRQMGELEVAKIMTGNALHDPARHLQAVERRAALPWDGVARALDRVSAPSERQQLLEHPPVPTQPPAFAPATTTPHVPGGEFDPPGSQSLPMTPIPGTTGVPARGTTP